ncbi:MAG: hypothetical protein ACHREM_15445 [Polyangiales bacterium]
MTDADILVTPVADSEGGALDTSSHPLDRDLQAEQARVLRQLGAHRRAKHVAECGTHTIPGRGLITCGFRDCPRCCAENHRRYAATLRAKIARIERPLVALLTLCSLHRRDLAATISRLRKLIATLRRRRCFAMVTRAAGALEPHLAAGGHRWLAHVHLVIDTCDSFDEPTVKRAWRALTGARGRFSLDADPALRTIAGFARYVTKIADWLPLDRAMSLADRRTLRAAIKGRRVLVSWGVAALSSSSSSPSRKSSSSSSPRKESE